MSAPTSRPSIPRPSQRPKSEPVPATAKATTAPPAKTTAQAAGAYAVAPPVIRERVPTLSLEEDDIVAAEELPDTRRSSPPPPPSARASSPPPPPRSSAPPLPARASSVPPPPQSEVRALGARHPSSSRQEVAVVIPPAAPVPAEATPIPTPAPMTMPSVATPLPAPAPTTLPAPPSVAPAPVSVVASAPSAVAASVPPPAATASVPPPASAPPSSFASPIDPARPASLLDPTDVLFDSIYDMQFAETPWQAAEVCAAALASALRARAVVVHAHDLVRREIRTIAAHGTNAGDVLGSFEASDDDLVASAVLCNGKPLTMKFDGELPRLAPKRLAVVGAQRSLVAVPALSWGRCVAMIEVIDADERIVARAPDAAAYVADHLAAFLVRQAA